LWRNSSHRRRVHDEGGHRLTEIGGPEKDHFNAWDAYHTGIYRTRDDRPLAVECFSLRPGEGVFGFGEKFLALDKVGQTVDLDMVEAMGTTTPRSYKNIPLFWTTGGWGVFLHHSARITCWVGSRAAADLQVAVEDDFLFVGSPKEILARYTDLTGRSAMPPRWSFGLWQSKISYRSADERPSRWSGRTASTRFPPRPAPRHPLVPRRLALRPGVRFGALPRPGRLHQRDG